MQKLYRVYRYALFLLDRFKYLILLALIAFVIATAVIAIFHPHQQDPQTRKGLDEIAFGVFELMFASEPALPYPKGSLPASIVFFMLPVLNVLGIAAAVAQFTQILFDPDVYNRAQADNAEGHIILCGLGRVGREVLKQLEELPDVQVKRNFVIVDTGEGLEALDTAFLKREPIIPVVRGNMIHSETLLSAGVKRAKAIVMLTGEDTTNLESALLARELNSRVRVVLRMSNKRVTERLDAMLRGSLVRNFILIDSVEGSAPKCVALAELPDEPVSVTPPGTDLSRMTGHVVICGLGRLGFGIVRLLKGKVPMVVIDQGDPLHYADEPEVTTEPVVPIVRADMTLRSVMQQVGAERAAAVLLMTSNDTQNLEAAMLVHELNSRVRTVLRINNSRISTRLHRVLQEAFGESIVVIDPSEFAAPLFVEAVTQR